MANQNNNISLFTDDALQLQMKYKKCLHITEEIYKRIHLTFETKKTESNDIYTNLSDQINSDELSEGTDLFAFDKSDSISSSSETARNLVNCDTFNNNIEIKFKKVQPISKKPKKRYRKRVKKHEMKKQPVDESDLSSDEACLKSRIVDLDTQCVDSPKDNQKESLEDIMGVPSIIIVSKDPKSKTSSYIIKRKEGAKVPH